MSYFGSYLYHMKKYKLLVNGWELNASGHELTDEEVQKIKDIQDEREIDDLSEIGYELEELLDDYYAYSTNMWVIDKPNNVTGLNFVLVEMDESGDEKVILEFTHKEMTDHMEIDEDMELTTLNGYPDIDNKHNILLWFEENKGTVCAYPFESEETPTAADFSMVYGCVETPDGDWDYMDKLFFKGQELEISYEEQWTRGKALTVELWTLSDVNYDEFDSDDEDSDEEQ